MKYLFVGAHPDDIEYSCGGTILRLIDEGHDVRIVLMTNGGAATNGDVVERKTEQMKAAAFANVKYLSMLGHRDGYITVTSRTISEIARILNSIEPDIVVTHYPQDSHQDHRSTAQIVKSAARRKYSIWYFDSYSSIDFKPNLYMCIDKYIQGKVELLRCFESQISKYQSRGVDFIRKSIITNETNGYESKCHFAEGFAIDTYII